MIFKRGILSAFLVTYEDVLSGVNLKGYCGLLLLKFCKIFVVFYISVVTGVILNLVLAKAFLSM